MTGLALQKKAVEVAVILNAAVANIRLYPPTSDIIGTSIGRLDTALSAILNEVDSVVFAESEKNLLVSGQTLNEKDQQKPQVIAFLELLRNTGIKSITFEKGVDKGELLALLEIASTQPEKIKTAGGLKQIFVAKNLSHIFLDQKVYVAMGKDQKVVSADANLNSESLSSDTRSVALSDIERRTGIERRQSDGSEYLKTEGPERRTPEDRRKIQISDYKDKLGSILKGETVAFSDQQVLQSLPGTIDQLFAKEKNKVAEALIDKLARGLLDEDPALRANVSKTLSTVSSRLLDEQRHDMLRMLSLKLVGWIKQEDIPKFAFEQICRELQSLLTAFIQNHQLEECIPILKIFRAIERGQLTKNESFQEISGSILTEIAAGDALDALVSGMQTDQKDQAIACLAIFGPVIIDRMLNLLHEGKDKSLQALILKVLTDMGSDAVPRLANRIEQDPPAETMRHLVAILGKVGGEENLEVLIPLVMHKDIRVQREALSSIFSIGGNSRGRLLLSLLPDADDQLQNSIIAMLGTLKHQEAVPDFLELLESKSIIASKSKNELAEKICVALGKIGSKEAIPALTAIAESKGLFKLKAHSASVQTAARDALNLIKR
ncbi:MAG: HEAT repeat domain-containing protein [Desulfobacterales bacterium]|nr:HEAT repeat domain-containing protein [Desulfobacterales bacterium]